MHQVKLDREAAPAHLDRLLADVRLWLKCNFVHGDLSPYNILYHRDRLTVIDFPQACDPRFNRNAQEFLIRDIEKVCAYFRTLGVNYDGRAFAEAMWRDFENARL